MHLLPTSAVPLAPMSINPMPINKQQVATAFGRAARSYEQHNELQRRSGHALLALLDEHLASYATQNWPDLGLDLGCGSGWFIPALKQKAEHLLALDLSPAMLQQARLKADVLALCADMDTQPLAEQSVDFIFANLCLQWSGDPAAWLAGWSQRLKPGGVLVFATLVEGSLAELDTCWQLESLPSPINRFIRPQELERHLANTGRRWRCDYATEQLAFADLKALLQSLKGIGANRVNAGRRSGLMGKQQWQRLNLAYATNSQGQSVATYQLAYGVIYG